jgi:hypothetical protein
MVKELQNDYKKVVINRMINILDECIILISKCLVFILIGVVIVMSRFLIASCISYNV